LKRKFTTKAKLDEPLLMTALMLATVKVEAQGEETPCKTVI